MFGAHVNDLVNEQGWEVVFGTIEIQIMKVRTNTDGSLFFVHRDKVANLRGVSNRVDETSCA